MSDYKLSPDSLGQLLFILHVNLSGTSFCDLLVFRERGLVGNRETNGDEAGRRIVRCGT